MPTSRRSYSIAEKVSILSSYDTGAQGSGFHALGRRHDISPSTIRGWWSHKEELQAALRDRQVPTRSQEGLRVKDSYIRLQAKKIYRQLYGADATGFEASSGWLARFKIRRNLVSRRQTTTRSLPVDVPGICRGFIQRAQYLIVKHGIKP
ncbi:hypothetical protein F444_19518 [Phytophthora nicotianae P1976]|uniref:HTH CENPB-type domain-containing protein n=1 Tax=Phytophthora nicotianae P1976 TaxID=1317066 RepID=A0A080Z7N1_PHYNI|nr:hypothetical protein F444_19518 [Phytophthora nicotianae P1976]